jgi:hypothetical protein
MGDKLIGTERRRGMADPPDKAPVKKPVDIDDAWPNTMKHYKWEKLPEDSDEPKAEEPLKPEEPQADGEP